MYCVYIHTCVTNMAGSSNGFLVWSLTLLIVLVLIQAFLIPKIMPKSTVNTTSQASDSSAVIDTDTHAVIPATSSAPSPEEKFLVVKCYNPESGFYWALYNVLCASHTARNHGMTLIVWFDSGLYLETQRKHQQQYKEYVNPEANSWFHYYFHPLAEGRSDLFDRVKSGKIFRNMVSFKDFDKEKRKHHVFEFDRAAYEVRDMNVDYSREAKITMNLRPHMFQMIENYYNEHMRNRFVVGIHVRGSDKWADGASGDNEDGPKHFLYSENCDMLEKAIRDHHDRNPLQSSKPVAILACSDEEPFIEYIQKRFANQFTVLTCDVFRSKINTSGVDLHSEDCREGMNTPNCRRYKEMAAHSIHRGHKHISNYKKGQDAVFEVSLLSRCDVFLRSRGNFSNFPKYLSPNLFTIDMVDEMSK